MPFHHLLNKCVMKFWHRKTCNGVLLPKSRNLAQRFGRNSVCTWKVCPHLHLFHAQGVVRLISRLHLCPCDSELQGHAIKNQDLLIASGTISSKGSEGMSAVDDDMEAAVSPCSCPPFFFEEFSYFFYFIVGFSICSHRL